MGKSKVAKISSESGVPYSRIYDVMESLIGKGIVKMIPEKTKAYIATNPEELLKLLRKKQEILKGAEEEIRSLKKFYDVTIKEPVILSYGKRNFYRLEKEMKKAKNYEYTLRYAAEVKPVWVREEKKAIKSGVDMKNLTRYDRETEKDVKRLIEFLGQRWKAIENLGIALSIRDDEQIIIALIKSNVTMLIRDKPFAKLMKTLFMAYWEQEPLIMKGG